MNEKIIMEPDEEDFIFSEIEKRMNKSIRGLSKLYQASIDGGEPINFHKKCDNIPNTLVLIKSEGKRRFGGFTPIPWKSKGGFIEDKKNQTFVFSLDNKKIYNLISIYRKAVYHHEDYGPCFGFTDIEILGNPIEKYKLRSIPDGYDYNGDKYPLSESDDSYNDGFCGHHYGFGRSSCVLCTRLVRDAMGEFGCNYLRFNSIFLGGFSCYNDGWL